MLLPAVVASVLGCTDIADVVTVSMKGEEEEVGEEENEGG